MGCPETKTRPPVAWWNEDCEREEKIVRAEYRKHRRDLTNINKLRTFQRSRAIKQRTFRKARKDSWNKFVNSLNSRTPTKKVGEKFRKVTGNYKPRRIPPKEKRGSIISTPNEIAEI